jgi:CheY-like chemotaxis protein
MEEFSPKKSTVLVVEDDPETQLYMRALLRSRYHVLQASSGDEMRQQLAAHPEIRLFLMDLSLKGTEDGLVLTRSLRRDPRWKSIPVVAVTAHALAEDKRRSLAEGCDAYFAKPFDRRELFAVMSELIGGATESC